ncbi:diguanylate cyclase [Vibrio sinensis]|uniref:diguanylate cyclase n=1 Tax=Vibrio sinensis TaxID=2302434 RepID=A0A3A6R005_9VIBR|nr:diguanylate cyclase [Vibrio sinensis]RJX74437.1 diguanylate cyclase [Vibrio sinensis]
MGYSLDWFWETAHGHGFDIAIILLFCFLFFFIWQYSQHQKQLDAIVQDAPMPLLLVEARSGRILVTNIYAMQLLGIRLVGKSYLLPESIPPKMMTSLIEQFSGKGFSGYQFDWPVSVGQSIAVEMTGRRTLFKGRSAWFLYVTPYRATDAETAKKMKALSIVNSVFDTLSELIFVKDNQGELIATNRAFNRYWGERIDEGCADIHGFMKGRANNNRWSVNADGQSCLLETSQKVLMSSQGEKLGMLSISHDVTDWYNVQQSLRDEMDKRKDTEVALAQRDTILQNILESSPDSIGIFNENRVYQACNLPFVKALGISDVNDLIGKRLEDVVPDKMYGRFSSTDDEVLTLGRSLRYIDQVLGTDGERAWYDVVKSPLKDPVSGTNGVLIMARDVSERYLAARKLEEANQELQRLSFIDGLTKISNRRRFDEQLETLWYLHVREQQPLTVMLCDIDYFKGYNDLYGHQKGDEALIQVAKVFESVLSRSSDCVARYGGEEFGFILPHTTLLGARLVAQKIHEHIAQLSIEHLQSKVAPIVTVSIGLVSTIPQAQNKCESIVALADEALYQAKADGRNQTSVHHTSDI